jgi:CxxC-x17-CxxC domain-containing protein
MRDFSKDRRPSGARDFKRRDFDRPQTMFKTICSDCGKECEVPFKPNGNKPVFCRDCFQGKRSSDSRRPNFEDRGNNPIVSRPQPVALPQYREQFESLNAKLDKILNLLVVKEAVKEVVVRAPVQVSKVEVPEVKAPVIKKKRVTKKSPTV